MCAYDNVQQKRDTERADNMANGKSRSMQIWTKQSQINGKVNIHWAHGEKLVTPKRSRQHIINYFCRRWRLIFRQFFVRSLSLYLCRLLYNLYFCYISTFGRAAALSFLFFCVILYSVFYFLLLLLFVSAVHIQICWTESFSLFDCYFWVHVYGKINDTIKPFLLCTHNAPICYSLFYFILCTFSLLDWMMSTIVWTPWICFWIASLYIVLFLSCSWWAGEIANKYFTSHMKTLMPRTI